MTTIEAKQRRDTVQRRLQAVQREVATSEGAVDSNIARLREVFGEAIPDDPTQIDFPKLEEEITIRRQLLEGEVESNMQEAEKLMGELDARLESVNNPK